MINLDKIIEVFCDVDDFFKEFTDVIEKAMLQQNTKIKRGNRKPRMNESEVMTIVILFHLAKVRDFKHFYIFYVKKHLQDCFPKTVSYNRMVELTQKVAVPLLIFLKYRSSENVPVFLLLTRHLLKFVI